MFSDLQRSSHWNGLKINLNRDWISSLEAKSYIEELLDGNGTRKVFTMFDSPPIPKIVHEGLKPEVKKFKLYMVGKAGVGKTSTTQNLLGINKDGKVYESMGLMIQTLFWPVCLVAKDPSKTKVVLVRLEIWECGARAGAQYPYLMEECVDEADACLLLFSLTDRKSWEAMPTLMGKAGESPTLQIMVGTRLDKFHESVVRVEEMRHFERLYNLPLLLIGNKTPHKEHSGSKSASKSSSLGASAAAADAPPSDAKQGMYEISAFLTQLCEYLLNADQIKSLQLSSIGSQI